MEYLNFDIEIGQQVNGRYPVSCHSPAGEASESFVLPYNEWQLHDKLKDLELALRGNAHQRRVQPPELQSVQEIGVALFNALLPGELRTCYDLSQRIASEQGKGLRVRLHIDAPELGKLPWEYLFDSRQGEYLCLSTYTPVIRYLELPQPILPLTITPPLRILGMVCSPSNLAELDVRQEQGRIEQALSRLQQQGLVELHWLEGSSWRDLQHAVSEAERTGKGWHVFHFIGHGDFNEITDEGRVALVGEDGKAEVLSATHLARLLADQRALRVVVLNACEGALGSAHDVFSSTAATLVRRGVVTVLAMQHAISDQAAIELSRTFYENLATGTPVDTSLCEARKAISMCMPYSVEWGTPVLFMRAPDGVLFHVLPSDSSSTQPYLKKPALKKNPPPMIPATHAVVKPAADANQMRRLLAWGAGGAVLLFFALWLLLFPGPHLFAPPPVSTPTLTSTTTFTPTDAPTSTFTPTGTPVPTSTFTRTNTPTDTTTPTGTLSPTRTLTPTPVQTILGQVQGISDYLFGIDKNHKNFGYGQSFTLSSRGKVTEFSIDLKAVKSSEQDQIICDLYEPKDTKKILLERSTIHGFSSGRAWKAFKFNTSLDPGTYVFACYLDPNYAETGHNYSVYYNHLGTSYLGGSGYVSNNNFPQGKDSWIPANWDLNFKIVIESIE